MEKILSIRLNNETLEYENNKLFFPSKDLTQSEIANINKKVFEGVRSMKLKKGRYMLTGSLLMKIISRLMFS